MKDQVQELLNIAEENLDKLKNNLSERSQLRDLIDEALTEASQTIDQGWDEGEDMTNENNRYISLIKDFTSLL